VYQCVVDYYNNKFPGGKTLVFQASNQGVGLPLETSKFASFSKADYDAIFSKLAGGAIPRMEDQGAEGGSPKGVVPVSITVITEVK
jgi:basic membrane protein A